jgi:hypothetical protein
MIRQALVSITGENPTLPSPSQKTAMERVKSPASDESNVSCVDESSLRGAFFATKQSTGQRETASQKNARSDI